MLVYFSFVSQFASSAHARFGILYKYRIESDTVNRYSTPAGNEIYIPYVRT